MSKNKLLRTEQQEEECEKMQQIDIIQPKRKRIQKRKTSKTKTKILKSPNTQEEKPIETEQFPIQFIQLDRHNHNCPICLEILVKTVSTVCGHSYCQQCLSEYLLFFEECLQCGRCIRNSRCSYNRTLDGIIEAIVSTTNENEKDDYQRRCQSSREYSVNKKVKSLQVGEIIDVRDKDYVWCEARIYRTICRLQQNRTKYVFVNYIGKSKNYNEQISQNSERLAAHGFYTSRKDILHYQNLSNGDLRVKSGLVFTNQERIIMVEQNQQQDRE